MSTKGVRMDKKSAHEEANRDYIKKGMKLEQQISKNELTKTIEQPAINDSVFETKNDGYNASILDITNEKK